MGYLYLFLEVLLFSFGGIAIKVSGQLFTPFMLSFMRFALGVLLLLVISVARGKRIRLRIFERTILLGGIFKAVHYLGENYGVTRGYSYGGILVNPVQAIAVAVVCSILFKQRISRKSMLGCLLSIVGVGIVTWNGAPIEAFLSSSIDITIALVIAGIGAALFSLAQKHLIETMDTVELNLDMFLVGAVVCLAVTPLGGAPIKAAVTLPPVLFILLLGFNTAVGFILQAEALRRVPILFATVAQSATSILTVVWAALLYHEEISHYVIIGTVMFLVGIVFASDRGRS